MTASAQVGVSISGRAEHAPSREEARPAAARGRDYVIRALEPVEFAGWEELVRESPQGTLFHSPLWLGAANVPYKLFGCFRGAELWGGFAAGLVGERAAGAPHPALTPYLGIVFPKPEAKYVTTISANKAVASAFAAFLRREFDSVQFRFAPEVFDLQPFIWEGFGIGVRYTYRVPLEDLDAVLRNMDAKRRNDIRNAERGGVAVESGAAFGQVMALSDKSFKRQGLEAGFSDAAFRFSAALTAARRCRGFLARGRGGEPLAAAWIVWDEKRAYYLVGGYDEGAETSGALSLALWRAIEFTARELRLREFDFEGSMVPAIERYFRKFGGTLLPTYTVSYQKRAGFAIRVARRLARLVK